MSAYDPLADVDAAALDEKQARRTEALEAVDAAIDAGKHVQARRDLEALEASAAAEAEAVPDPEASGADGPPTLDSLRKRLDEADPVGAAGIRPLAAMAGDLPRPVLWMDSRRGGGTVLRAGDVAALGGAGGVGKSFATLALAVAAAEPGDGPGDAVGLHVRRGPAVLIGYEDDPATVAWRAGLIAARSGPIPDPAPDALHLVPDPEPLMTADPNRPGAAAEAPGWRTLWRGVRKLAPSLVIVDPASAALADANQNDGATVRRFIRALAREAERGGWGVLLVAHSTKAARYGGDPGPGAIAGSGQWWDACRGVLHMRGDGPGRAAVECLKANHGPHGWAVTLEADWRTRTDAPDLFAGWRRSGRFGPQEWAAELKRRKANGNPESDTSGKRGGNGPYAPGEVAT